jgi:integrase
LRQANPATGVRLPRLDDTGDEEMVVLTHDEFRLLRDCIKPDARDMLTVFAATGLRYSELTVLQVSDLDLTVAPPVLRLRRAWKRQPDNTFALGPPKTIRSRRAITLSGEIGAALEPYAAHKTPEEFLFTTRNDRWWRHGAFHG